MAGASTLDAYVPPGQSRIVPAPNLPTNAVGERIVLNGDDNDFDNSVYLVRPQAEEINLIYLGDEAENDPKQSLYFVKRAFHDTRRQTVRIHVPQAGAEAPFSNCRLLIVSAPIPESSQVAVRQFVNSGGTAVLVMKDTNSVVALSQLTGINKSSTYNLINTFVELGFLSKDEKTKMIKVGPNAIILSHNLMSSHYIFKIVQKFISYTSTAYILLLA